MFEKTSDFVTGAFVIFYVAFSHLFEAHTLCLLAIALGLNLVARSILGTSPLKTLADKLRLTKKAL
jgi:hypothetical protein